MDELVAAVIANVIANLVTAAIFVVLGLVGVFCPLFARAWVGFWCWRCPEAADALRAHFTDEMDVQSYLRRIGRALLFVFAVPSFARTQAQAERSRNATKAATPPAVTEADGLTAQVHGLVPFQARWPFLLDRFQAPLLGKMLLSQVVPVAIEGNVVTLMGPIDELDRRRLDSVYRPTVEALFTQEFGLPIRVRFSNNEVTTSAEVPTEELAAAMFWSQLVPVCEPTEPSSPL